MAFLLTEGGQPLLLADGQRVRKGSLVVDSIFGEGVVTGTVPLAHGEGVNLSIACLYAVGEVRLAAGQNL